MRLILALAWVAALAGSTAAERLPRSVLIFDQTQTDSPWGVGFRSSVRSEIGRTSKTPVVVYSEVLELGRFNSPRYEEGLRQFLREKYRDRPFGVIIVHGSTALEVFMRLRADLWPSVPVVFGSVDPEVVARLNLPPDVTGTTFQLSLRNVAISARTLVPHLKRIALVGSKYEKDPFRSHFVQELASFAGELEFIDLLDLPLTEVAKRVATLPDDAVVYYSVLYSRAGVPASLDLTNLVPFLAQLSNRPIVSDNELHLGLGSIGGIVAFPGPIGAETARRALRILDGEPAARMLISGGDFTKPVFDWRQLQRWNISEANLPSGSEIRFRSPGIWEQYRWQMIAVTAAIAFQSLLIAGLLLEHRRRLGVEVDLRRRVLEVAHLNRSATAGVMSASIAHELNQPLGSILLNTETADLLLKDEQIDRKQLEEILAEIRRDDERAAKIIKGLAGFLKKKDIDLQSLDLNEALQGALQIIEPVAARRGVLLKSSWLPVGLPVRADPVHIQQVILNLAMNAMDAMQDVQGARSIMVQTNRASESEATVVVSDTGPGVPREKLDSIFETFYTTKQQGSGLGLSIARTIVEIYGGKIWAENRHAGGATFIFTLPLATGQTG